MLTWIAALKVFNAGSPSWCIPKKGTPGYKTVERIRKGEKVETTKEIIDRLERKTTGKSKKVKKTQTISLT